MLPTPAKFHYVFNLRDLSRIWEGMLTIKGPECKNLETLIKLWRHECLRVIHDRFTTFDDRNWFISAIDTVLKQMVPEFSEHFPAEDTYFVDFLRDPVEPTGDEGEDFSLESPKIYEEIPSYEETTQRVLMYMSQFNEQIRGANMDLVFFRDALVHLIIISRIIRTPRLVSFIYTKITQF